MPIETGYICKSIGTSWDQANYQWLCRDTVRKIGRFNWCRDIVWQISLWIILVYLATTRFTKSETQICESIRELILIFHKDVKLNKQIGELITRYIYTIHNKSKSGNNYNQNVYDQRSISTHHKIKFHGCLYRWIRPWISAHFAHKRVVNLVSAYFHKTRSSRLSLSAVLAH